MDDNLKTHLWKFRLLIDERHDIELLDSDQVKGVLVVNEFDVLPVDTFVIVFFLLELEYMLNEKLLEIFVCIVNAELFKAVVIEIFKAEYVKNSDRASCHILRSVYRLVYLFNYQHEQAAVYTFHKCVSDVHRLISR